MTGILISNSEIQTWKDCRRRWWLTYYRELGVKRHEDKPVGARQLGTRIHIALCRMYQDGVNPVDAVNEVYSEDEKLFPDKIEDMRKEQDLAKAMLEGYLEWLAETGADEGLDLVAAETVIEVPMDKHGFPGVKIRGKLDQRVVRKVDGARLFLDHKTVGDLVRPIRMLPLDEQMKFYHLLERMDALHKTNGEPQWRTDGGLYNMLRKVKRTATARPPFYDRAEVRHNDATLRTMWSRVSKVIEEIVQVRDQLDHGADHQYVCPPRPAPECTWKCDFLAICPMFDDGSNIEGLIEEYYTHVDPHERYQAQDAGRDVTE